MLLKMHSLDGKYIVRLDKVKSNLKTSIAFRSFSLVIPWLCLHPIPLCQIEYEMCESGLPFASTFFGNAKPGRNR